MADDFAPSKDGVALGASNLFVPTSEVLFVAPSLVVHYIDAHQYRPPDSFLDAVDGCAEMRSLEYLRALARFRKPAREPLTE